MKLLLDTNCFLWASREPNLLTKAAVDALSAPGNERYVSIASLWEMQIKHSIGKLSLPGEVDRIGPAWLAALDAQVLPIEMSHLGTLYKLPDHHRDPFDRIIVAQATVESAAIVSPDAALGRYPVPVIW